MQIAPGSDADFPDAAGDGKAGQAAGKGLLGVVGVGKYPLTENLPG